MSKYNSFYDTVDQIVSYGVDKGILHLYTGDDAFEGVEIILQEKKIINFGSCSYLGLEFDQRLKAGAIEAINKFGTQFSESRAYVSLGYYKILQDLLEKIFGAFCVITPTTTLGHIANIPVIVDDKDIIILDQQVHNSVQTAVQIVKARGVPVDVVRHNRMDLLEEKVIELRGKYKKIWYMADGIYSMFGDCAPGDDIYRLMDKYPEFYFYVDDAHGMSIHGENGRGYILSKHSMHRQMVMATSLNKAFAAGGGVLVYADKELARKVGTVGGPLLSSGPMQPSALGAAIAAAQIHLSPEIISMQKDLHSNIEYTRSLLDKYRLPVISEAGAAIFFVGVSLPKLGHNLVKRMLDAGFYVNLGVFPTVPMKQTGIRFTVTRLHSKSQIKLMVEQLAKEFPIAMAEEMITIEEIYKAFKKPLPSYQKSAIKVENSRHNLTVTHLKSIEEVNQPEWDNIFDDKGTFNYKGLQMLERSFTGNALAEENWEFDYTIVRDNTERIIVATFFTTTLWKDDMLSTSAISKEIEKDRISNPYFLTSKVTCAGSLITEGEHVYINYEHPAWISGLELLFNRAYTLQTNYQSSHIVLRDFKENNHVLDSVMIDNGFFKIKMPDTNVISEMPWSNTADFYRSLSLNARNQLRKKVLRHGATFHLDIFSGIINDEVLDEWYRLYLNVKNNSLELNTFALPRTFFEEIMRSSDWEAIQLSVSDEGTKICGVIFCFKGHDNYIPMIIGIDYTYNRTFNVYRQGLYQVVLRAKQLNKSKISLGFSASVEKQKLGATSIPVHAYMHTVDSYNMELISNKMALAK